MSDDGIEVRGPLYAIIPEWVLDEASDRAVHLYARLNRYANKGSQAWPTRATLAKHLKCSPASVDRAVKELASLGAMTVQPRRDPENPKRYLSSIYTLSVVKGGPLTGDEGGSSTSDEGVAPPVMTEPKPLNESHKGSRRSPETPLPDGQLFITQPMKDWVFAKGYEYLDIQLQTERFVNHALQNDRRCRDWVAAWRNWIIGAAERTPKPNAEDDGTWIDWHGNRRRG